MYDKYMFIWILNPTEISNGSAIGYEFFESKEDLEIGVKSMMIRHENQVHFPFIGEISKRFNLKEHEKIEQLKTYNWRVEEA